MRDGGWGSSKLLLPGPRTALQVPDRQRKASVQAISALPLGEMLVSIILLSAPTQPPNRLRPNLGQLGDGGREEKEEANLGGLPISSEFSLRDPCGQGPL